MTEKELFTYVNFIICAELMQEYISDLNGTSVYRQEIKNRCKLLSTDLDKVLSISLPKMFSADEQFTINCMKELKNLVENISSLSMNDLIVYSQLIKDYKENPDRFIDKHQLTLTKIE